MKTYFTEDFNDAALTVLDEHPGCNFEEWADALCSQFPLEITDAFGCDEGKVMVQLREWWGRQTDFNMTD